MNRVKKYRMSAGMTQAELARITGLGRGTIYSLEKTGGNLQSRTARLISEALNVPVRALIGEEEVGCKWQDSEYRPSSEGDYLVAYKPMRRGGYNYAVLKWKQNSWWDKTVNGDLLAMFNPEVLWWSRVSEPPI